MWVIDNKLNIGDKEIKDMIRFVWSSFEHRKLLQNQNNLKIEVLFLKSLFKSWLSYGCHALR